MSGSTRRHDLERGLSVEGDADLVLALQRLCEELHVGPDVVHDQDAAFGELFHHRPLGGPAAAAWNGAP